MAFRIAISGLRAATADLDVTGNNIANNTTTGFKASRAQFADIYAVSSLGGSQQVQLTAVAQQFNQGNVSFTDNSLDLAISGEGFFVLDDGGTQIYSRAGAFGLDKNGFITNASGHTLVAFQAAAGAVTGATGPLQLSTANIPPQASTAVTVGVNLDAGATVPAAAFDPTDPNSFNNSTSVTVFDSLGQQHLAAMFFRKTGSNA